MDDQMNLNSAKSSTQGVSTLDQVTSTGTDDWLSAQAFVASDTFAGSLMRKGDGVGDGVGVGSTAVPTGISSTSSSTGSVSGSLGGSLGLGRRAEGDGAGGRKEKRGGVIPKMPMVKARNNTDLNF